MPGGVWDSDLQVSPWDTVLAEAPQPEQTNVIPTLGDLGISRELLWLSSSRFRTFVALNPAEEGKTM